MNYILFWKFPFCLASKGFYLFRNLQSDLLKGHFHFSGWKKILFQEKKISFSSLKLESRK